MDHGVNREGRVGTVVYPFFANADSISNVLKRPLLSINRAMMQPNNQRISRPKLGDRRIKRLSKSFLS